MTQTSSMPAKQHSYLGLLTRWVTPQSLFRALEISGLFTFLLALGVVFALSSGQFLTGSNFRAILTTSAVLGIVAIGQTFAIIAGGFDLSVAGVIPLASVLYAMTSNAGVPTPLAILAMLALGAVVGLINGLMISRVGIDPLIATLAMLSITGGFAFTVTNGVAVPFDHDYAGVLADSGPLNLSVHVWLVAGLVVVGVLVLRYTVFGRMVYALGGSREASWLAGVRVSALTTAVYMLCSMMAALAGVVLASELLSGSGNLGTDAALNSVAAVVLGGGSLAGGVGTVWGTAVGVLILGTLANGMALQQISSFYQTIATGVVLLLAVAFSRLRAAMAPRFYRVTSDFISEDAAPAVTEEVT
jgi:ribose/xylose/arabinose/galactoside ABC-type transport system permease subunit